MASSYDPNATDANLVCVACGTQFPTSNASDMRTCFICDDPRQYTPPTGQAFTTMGELRATHKNVFHTYGPDPRLTSIVTAPKLAIGQRAILVKTPGGNILWDCLTLLDAATVAFIRSVGGLAGIVISHPHYYSSHTEWAAAFDCPVYMSVEDKQWLARSSEKQVFLDHVETAIGGEAAGLKAIKLGGHFPGSLVALFDGRLLIADTLVTTPAGLGNWKANALGEPRDRPPGLNSFAFLWSIPNAIPLSGEELYRMWGILKRYEFRSTHGAFSGVDIEDEGVKKRVLESMMIQTKFMGWTNQTAWECEA